MAVQTLPALLTTLQKSLDSAVASLPQESDLAPPTNGISLFDTKNELFLSYLHNLVFLILFKIRQKKEGTDQVDAESEQKIWNSTVQQLVSLRHYLDRGVKPLEGKLRYEIDRVLQAAEDAVRSPAHNDKTKRKQGEKRTKANAKTVRGDGASGSEDENEGSEVGSEEESESEPKPSTVAARPNLANMGLPASMRMQSKGDDEAKTAGVYRPPRINPTALPTGDPETRRARSRPAKSETLDEYLEEEFSTAPQAMPSIGSNIVRSGRRTQTAKERKAEQERREYEETNYTRLPGLSRKEKRKQEKGGQGRGYGGEEWRDLGAGAERIMRTLDDRRRKTGYAEKSRKRVREEQPSADIGASRSVFEKRRKVLAKQRKG